MSLLFKDLLHDLREKRLWPVAALLLLAIVAVPAVLLRSPSEDGAPAPAPPVAAGAQADAAVVALAGEGEVPASSLDSFEAKDPFRSRGSAVPTPPAQEPVAPPVQEPGGDGSGSGSSPLPPSTSGGGGSSPASGGSPGSPATPPAQPDPVLYTYVVDVRFGRRGKERAHNGVARMEPLPDSEQPLLVFLGTTASGRSAVFLVDQALEQRGEGICEPTRSQCSLLHLREDADHDLHFFTDTEGRGYALRLLDIELVPVEDAVEKNEDEAAGAKRSRTKRDDHRARWPFDVTPFADLAR
ncbi:MAG: hypothetical protein WD844_14345 [Thermoleophilaceae bacterium]